MHTRCMDRTASNMSATAGSNRCAGIQTRQLYGVGTISVEWTDDKGKMKREGGEGNLIFRKPGDVAMLFRKLGKVYVWGRP